MTLPLPDSALEADIAILGRKGGGKTYTAKGIVERLLSSGGRVLILDPLGVWAGLRSGADGEQSGFPVAIFGGAHGDMPLDTAAAAPTANVLARENVPAVIDLSDLSKGAQQSFLLTFLHELRRVNTAPLTIVLEEADVFAPQNPMGDDSKALFSEIDWIARRGRFKGFRLITITQRPARLSKDVLTQCATLIVHRLPAPQDREAVKAWVDGNGDRDRAREVFDTLAQLAVGEAWVWASEEGTLLREKFPPIKTLDTSATPRAGGCRIEPKMLAEVDMSCIKAALAAVASDSPSSGRRKNGSEEAVTKETCALKQAAERRGYERGIRAAAEHVRHYSLICGVGSARGERIIEADDGRKAGAIFADDILSLLAEPEIFPTSIEAPKVIALPSPPSSSGRTSAFEAANRGSNPRGGTITLGAERRVLAILARTFPAGMSEAQWAVAAGMKRSGGTWATYKSRLRVASMIVQRAEQWFATELGLAAIGDDIEPMPPPGPQLVEFWSTRITGVRPMLALLAANYPKWLSRDELAAKLNLAARGGTFNTYLSRLRTAGLIETSGTGAIRAASALMEVGRS